MLLQTLMPYLVIVGVAVLFFLVCCRIVLRKPKKMNRKEHISFSHIKKHATVNEKSVENIRKNTDLEKTQVINLKNLSVCMICIKNKNKNPFGLLWNLNRKF